MIVRIEDLKDVCAKISSALDESENDQITGVLKLFSEDNLLYLIVSNREQYVKAKIDTHSNQNFDATVKASLFLNLISKTTSDTVEFKVEENYLEVVCNGTYKLPLIFGEDGELLSVPDIAIENVNLKFNVNKDILKSISVYNAQEIKTATVFLKPINRMFYIDEHGCITYSNTACVNNFELEKPIKLLLDIKTVNLFKLFNDTDVTVEFGVSEENGEAKYRIKFYDSVISVSSKLNMTDIPSFKADAIRKVTFDDYRYSVSVNRVSILGAVDRLLLFYNPASKSIPSATFEFDKESVKITGANGNSETIYYDNNESLSGGYKAVLDLRDVKATLGKCVESHVTMNFGNSQSFVIARGNVYNTIPEMS